MHGAHARNNDRWFFIDKPPELKGQNHIAGVGVGYNSEMDPGRENNVAGRIFVGEYLLRGVYGEYPPCLLCAAGLNIYQGIIRSVIVIFIAKEERFVVIRIRIVSSQPPHTLELSTKEPPGVAAGSSHFQASE